MSLGGISNIRPGGSGRESGPNSGGTNTEGQEFSLEKQDAKGSNALVKSHDVSSVLSKNTRIVDKTKRNRKGAPRTIIVDGEIYEVFLLAIA